jgi:hypothetical protein
MWTVDSQVLTSAYGSTAFEVLAFEERGDCLEVLPRKPGVEGVNWHAFPGLTQPQRPVAPLEPTLPGKSQVVGLRLKFPVRPGSCKMQAQTSTCDFMVHFVKGRGTRRWGCRMPVGVRC